MPMVDIFLAELAPEAAAEFFPTAAETISAAAAPSIGEAFMGATNAGVLNALGAGGSQLAQPVVEGVLSGGAGAGGAGINAAQVAAQQTAATQAANSGIPQIFQNAVAGGGNEAVSDALARAAANQTPAAQIPTLYGSATQTAVAPTLGSAAPSGFETISPAGLEINTPYVPGWTPEKELLSQVPGGRLPPAMTGSAAPIESEGIMGAFNKAVNWAKENPWSAASMGMNALRLLGGKDSGSTGPEPYTGILTKYKMSPDFQPRFARPEDYQYTPRRYAGGGPVEMMSNANSIGANTGYPMADINKGAYATPWQTPISRSVLSDSADTGVNPITGDMTNFASGGIASYKSGGEAAMDYYQTMTRLKANPPSGKSDPGAKYAGDVFYDLDPDTRYLDPVTAAQIRQAKVNKRAGMQLAGMKRPTPMGQLNLVPVTMKGNPTSVDTTEAARGGIMSLGGYAAGGNPRLLKGPGDGMSDDIPATIANKQPARLADGEFVVPADVVSHLGNGSTDAGAKKLHDMMTEVRKARTGNPKQGKQINPNKYIPT